METVLKRLRSRLSCGWHRAKYDPIMGSTRSSSVSTSAPFRHKPFLPHYSSRVAPFQRWGVNTQIRYWAISRYRTETPASSMGVFRSICSCGSCDWSPGWKMSRVHYYTWIRRVIVAALCRLSNPGVNPERSFPPLIFALDYFFSRRFVFDGLIFLARLLFIANPRIRNSLNLRAMTKDHTPREDYDSNYFFLPD